MRFVSAAAVLVTAACTGGGYGDWEGAAAGFDAAAVAHGGDGGAATAEAEAPPPYGPEVLSLRLKRSIVVRFTPDIASPKAYGTVEAGTRVGWTSAATGPGCDRWIEIAPRGWVCDKYLEPTPLPPAGVVLPRVEDGQLVPGVYGKVAGTGVTVRKVGEVKVGARTYWKIAGGKKIDARKIRIDVPSTFAGVWIDGMRLPFAWAQSRKLLKAEVEVRGAADARAPVIAKLAPRTLVPVEETSADGGWARIGEGRWVALADLHVARESPPPDDLRGLDERWIDVDTDEQVLVAYEGRRPVYATMVSTGSRKWPTAPGIYRIWLKFSETDMNGQMGDEQPYSVATVPWTMFFAKDLGFHTAYWHDKFGEARSHGCVNLSPIDARTLYEWAPPDVPLGWSMSHGLFERPGALVKIHGAATPAVEYRGYAKRVYEARAAGHGVSLPQGASGG
jgi:hypothetical protein